MLVFTYSIWFLLDMTAPTARSNTVQLPPPAEYGHRNYFSFQPTYMMIIICFLNSSIVFLPTAAVALVVLFELTLFLRAISFHSNVLYTLSTQKYARNVNTSSLPLHHPDQLDKWSVLARPQGENRRKHKQKIHTVNFHPHLIFVSPKYEF